MIKLTGHIDIPLDRLDAVSAALPDHIALTRQESGNLTFNVTQNPDIPNRFDVSETFVDQTAFDFHQTRTAASHWAEITKGIPRHFKIEEVAD